MCAIIDSCVRDQLVGQSSTAEGKYFREWLNKRKGHLVVGGKLLRELSENVAVKMWISNALSSGIAKRFTDYEINLVASTLKKSQACVSNDEHIIALAKVSGARLLFTTDKDLMIDFKNRKLLGGSVRGKVYTSSEKRPGLRQQHKTLLARTDLCDLK